MSGSEYKNPSRPFLIAAFWANAALSVVAVLLACLYGIFLLNLLGRVERVPLSAFTPLWYVALTLFYWDILAREVWRPTEQRPLIWLVFLTLAGFVSLSIFVVSVLELHHGSSIIFLPPIAIGCLAVFVVCRIVLDKSQLFCRA